MAMIPKVNPAVAAAPAAGDKPTLSGKMKPVAESHPGPAAEPAPETTAVAVAAPRAVAVSRPKLTDPIKAQFKDAFQVDWNTLHRVQANQGNFLDLEKNKEVIGSELGFELMSYQDNWQISPGTDDKADKEFVRYSNDGKTTNQGEDCAEYLAQLIDSGRTKAKMTQRCTLAGVVQKPGHALDGELIQIDFSQSTRQLFERFRMQTTLNINRGVLSEDALAKFTMKCRIQTQGDNSWTVVDFSYPAA